MLSVKPECDTAMRKLPPRLYLDPGRGQWVIRDGALFVRTGLAEGQHHEAEQALHQYLASKHTPQPSPSPLIADVLIVYGKQHLPHTRARVTGSYTIGKLGEWWGHKRVADITPEACRAYIAHKGKLRVAARRDLQTLKAAVRYWHASEYGPLERLPVIVMPPAPEPRDRWLTRSELARLLWAARRTPHLARFILVGYYTGSRSGVVRELQWSWIDFNSKTMRRRAIGEAENATKRRPVVRLGRRILSHLRRWKRIDGPSAKYVVHYNGQPIKDALRHSWNSAIEKAGLDSAVIPHTLRHSRATHLMQAGADIWQVSGFLGMSLTTLQRTYGHHHPDYQKGVADL